MNTLKRGLDTTSYAQSEIGFARDASVPRSVNLHFWPWCNYHCTFCFARHPSNIVILEKVDWIQILDILAVNGVEKVNFAGGEPTLCPWLPELVRHAKSNGLVTSIITNGFGVSPGFLDACGRALDIAGFSVDSSSEQLEQALGRGNGDHVARVVAAARLVKARGIIVKLNTVVTALNWQDDMSPVLDVILPDRWKVFQVLRVDGHNDANFDTLSINDWQFEQFIQCHARYNPIAENNSVMGDSYCMVDPSGRAYQLVNGRYVHSRPILDVGLRAAVKSVGFNAGKFGARHGDYYRSIGSKKQEKVTRCE